MRHEEISHRTNGMHAECCKCAAGEGMNMQFKGAGGSQAARAQLKGGQSESQPSPNNNQIRNQFIKPSQA